MLVLREGHHVHVALHYDNAARLADALACLEQTVELAAFLEQRGLRRVKILGFGPVEHAPAEPHHLAALADDGEHQAVAKAVVALALLAWMTRPASTSARAP